MWEAIYNPMIVTQSFIGDVSFSCELHEGFSAFFSPLGETGKLGVYGIKLFPLPPVG